MPDESQDGPFIGETVQVAVVTDDLYRGIDNLVQLGIGPFAVFKVSPENCTELSYQGEPAEYEMTLAFTTANNMMWEVIQPGAGKTIYSDFLDAGGYGLHHVAANVEGSTYAERAAGMRARGYREIQGGIAFNGAVPFSYWDNGNPDSPIVEIFEFPENFEPEPDEIYPAPES